MIRPSPELDAMARRWLHAIFNQQPKVATNMFAASEALSYIGTDDAEFWAGDTLRQGYGAHMSEADASTMEELDIEAWQGADMGWARIRATVNFQNADKPTKLRQTMVFLLEDGLWRIVHVHNSNPVPNIEAFGYAHSAYEAFLASVGKDDLKLAASGSATVMFTDIADSSALAEALGDARWARIVSDHLALVDQVLAAHGGRLTKTMGDGTMSTFSSAGQALKAAIDIQTKVAAQAGEPRLMLRIGLNTGDIVQAGEGFLGTVVNKAARIASMARPGEIRVSDATRAMVGGTNDFAFSAPATVALKGLGGDHTLYRLEWRT